MNLIKKYDISKSDYIKLRKSLRCNSVDITYLDSSVHELFQFSSGVVFCKMDNCLEAMLLAPGITDLYSLEKSFDEFVRDVIIPCGSQLTLFNVDYSTSI